MIRISESGYRTMTRENNIDFIIVPVAFHKGLLTFIYLSTWHKRLITFISSNNLFPQKKINYAIYKI